MTKIQEDILASSEQKLVRSALAEIGVYINDIYDLVKMRTPDIALPILLNLMTKVTHPAIKQGVIRSLSSKNATHHVRKTLIKYYDDIDETDWGAEDTKWVIANTLEIIAADDVASDLIKLSKDKKNGKSRQMIVVGLSKLKDPEVFNTLIYLIDDMEIVGHVIISLKRLGNSSAVSYINTQLYNPNLWIRREAKKAIDVLSLRT